MKKKEKRGEGQGINRRAVIDSLGHVSIVNDLNSTDHLINMLMSLPDLFVNLVHGI